MPAPSLNCSVTDRLSPATGASVISTLCVKACAGSGVSAIACGPIWKLVASVLPAMLTIFTETPVTCAARLPAGSAFTRSAIAWLIVSRVSPATTRCVKFFTVPPTFSVAVQVWPACGAPLSTSVLVAVEGHGASKVTV
jgi:hypothetical protein